MQRALKRLNRVISFSAFQFSAFYIISTVSISYEGNLRLLILWGECEVSKKVTKIMAELSKTKAKEDTSRGRVKSANCFWGKRVQVRKSISRARVKFRMLPSDGRKRKEEARPRFSARSLFKRVRLACIFICDL